MADDTSNTSSSNAKTPAASKSDVTGVQDRVVMASRHADGTPAQSDDFVFIGDKDDATAGAVHQLQSVAYAALQTSSDPEVAPTEDEQAKAADAAEAKAKAEVDQRHEGDASA